MVDGQRQILEILRKDINEKKDLIIWNAYPKWEQLKYVLALAWDNLLKEGETTSPMNRNNLPRVVFGYSREKTIFWLVNDTYDKSKEKRDWANKHQENILTIYKKLSKEKKIIFKKQDSYKEMTWSRQYFQKTDDELYDIAIREAFNILRHWFQYKVPKWLRVVNSLQEFVCNERSIKEGNYSYYADIIESDFVRDNLSILLEYGIPRSAITKLEKHIDSGISEDEVIKMLKRADLLEKTNLMKYEKEKIDDSL